MKQWTKEEINFLKNNYATNLNKYLGQKLNRSISSISYKALEIGLKKDNDFYCKSRRKLDVKITKEILENLYFKDKKSIREIAKILGLSKNTADYYLKKFNIKKRSKLEANKIGATKSVPWQKGLTKETDKRLQDMGQKVRRTYKKKREQKYQKIHDKYKKPLYEIINELYWKENLTQEKISIKLSLSRLEIIRLMKKFDISKRPNFEFISSLKGKNHSMYGKTWEDIYGVEGARKWRREYSLKMRKAIIRRLQNNEMPFIHTSIEKEIAESMKKRGINFIAQYAIDEKFVCDFAIPKYKIIIECDGDYWHANPKLYSREKFDLRQKTNTQRDKFKDKYLSEKGWKVLRFFESDIKRSASKCIDKIEEAIKKSQSASAPISLASR